MTYRNCPNCGAPVNIEYNECAYCGTSYYDLSLMPLRKPFFLKVNIGTDENPQIIMSKVICTNLSINNSINCCPEMELSFDLYERI